MRQFIFIPVWYIFYVEFTCIRIERQQLYICTTSTYYTIFVCNTKALLSSYENVWLCTKYINHGRIQTYRHDPILRQNLVVNIHRQIEYYSVPLKSAEMTGF